MHRYTAEERERLKNRWNGDLINHIVIALNEGTPFDSLLAGVDPLADLPPVQDGNDFRGIDFSHQNLRGPWTLEKGRRYRAGVDLRNADFSCADLSWAMLPHADLRGALFVDADLSFAELILSDLSGADLTGAQMTGAWLLDTKFYEAAVTEEQLQMRQNRGQLDFDYYAFEK